MSLLKQSFADLQLRGAPLYREQLNKAGGVKSSIAIRYGFLYDSTP